MRKYTALKALETSLTAAERDYVPQSGDYVYFCCSNATSSVTVSHVGIVMDVEDGLLMTIEGNAGSKVGKRIYDLDDPRIVGFGRPPYAFSESRN